jgi:hypothetical protein
MPSEDRHPSGEQTYPVVRLAGRLDAVTAPLLRSAILTALGAQPRALVVDARELDAGHADAVTAVTGLFREAEAWPGTRFAVAARPADAVRWDGAGLMVHPSPEAAFAAFGPPAPDDRVAATLEPVVTAARRARELVEQACARWGLTDLAAAACIVLTEMVNNAVAHARTEMTVLLARYEAAISVAVRDRSRTIPTLPGGPAPVTAYGGRGLLLIDAEASRWGCLALPGGKVVWACIGTPLAPQDGGREFQERGKSDRRQFSGMAPCPRG